MGSGERGDEIIRVGYALPPKKVETVITQSLTSHALNRGILLIPVHLNKPLLDQGPFQCLIHKIYSPDWTSQLLNFKSKNPNVVIVDMPDAIQHIQNRLSMLDFINQIPHLSSAVSFGIPQQIVVNDANAQLLNDPNSLLQSLSFPIIVKPLAADGSAQSHEMCLVFDAQALVYLRLPVVLQEFVNHGGVVFKVYVAGNHVKCVKRKSLPDASSELELQAQGGVLNFSCISNMAGEKQANFLEEAEMPPVEFVDFVAKELRQALGLHLFNFDMIRDFRVPEGVRYLIIDINYFPGYAKLPDYEIMLVDFLCEVVKHSHSKDVSLRDIVHDDNREGEQGLEDPLT